MWFLSEKLGDDCIYRDKLGWYREPTILSSGWDRLSEIPYCEGPLKWSPMYLPSGFLALPKPIVKAALIKDPNLFTRQQAFLGAVYHSYPTHTNVDLRFQSVSHESTITVTVSNVTMEADKIPKAVAVLDDVMASIGLVPPKPEIVEKAVHHIESWGKGQEADPGTGYHHLAHAIALLLELTKDGYAERTGN